MPEMPKTKNGEQRHVHREEMQLHPVANARRLGCLRGTLRSR